MAKLISVITALQAISDTATPMVVQTLPLAKLAGHVLADDMFADITLPPLDASAMDGYAIMLEPHHDQGTIFTQIGESPAGNPFEGTVGSGQTVRIFTGGAVPEGTNHVIMQENVRADGNMITLTEPVSPFSHIRKAGIDFHKGQLILSAGTMLDAYGIALLAAANISEARVFKRPKVALIANGDELVEPGTALGNSDIVSSNPYGLAPLIRAWGAEPVFAGISSDDLEDIKIQLSVCEDADILVPIGGASVGDRDYMRTVFVELGYQKVFEKVAVKPGKPVWYGTLGKQYVLGLPGNPASALVTAHIFLKSLIDRLINADAPGHKYLNACITHPMKASTWRTEYIRAHASIDDYGTLHVTPCPRQDSSLLTPFIEANCFLVRKPESPTLEAGDFVEIMLIKPLG